MSTTNRLDKKIEKIKAKQALFLQQIEELEAQKKAMTISLEHPEIQDLKKIIEETASNLRVPYKRLISVLGGKDAVRGSYSTKPAMIKYRDTAPGCENNTWSGRGIAPLWLQRYEAVGRNRSEFAVK